MQRVPSCREHHDAWVGAWVARAAKDLRPVQRLALFDQAFAGIWARAHPALGELTLSTLFERTLRDAVGAFPQLSSLSLEPAGAGVCFRELRESGRAAGDPELLEALRFLLVELLTALGSLTGETLTPALHKQLATSGSPPANPAAARRPDPLPRG